MSQVPTRYRIMTWLIQQCLLERSRDVRIACGSLMADLAGNAMALPVLLAILQSAVCAVDIRETVADVTEQDTQAVLAAFDLVGP